MYFCKNSGMQFRFSKTLSVPFHLGDYFLRYGLSTSLTRSQSKDMDKVVSVLTSLRRMSEQVCGVQLLAFLGLGLGVNYTSPVPTKQGQRIRMYVHIYVYENVRARINHPVQSSGAFAAVVIVCRLVRVLKLSTRSAVKV